MNIQLKVNDKLYSGWQDVGIQKSMLNIADSFRMKIMKGLDVEITNNDLIEILVEGKVFFTGYMDNYSIRIGDTIQPLELLGRSKAMDLVDCNILDNKQYSNLNIVQIITDLVSPFEINVTSDLSLNILETFDTKIGETYFDAINRLCKQTNTLPISTKNGNIKIIKNQEVESSIILTDADFKDIYFTQNYVNRFSTYTYKKESILEDVSNANEKDLNISRFRPFVAVNTEDKTNIDLANWKMNLDKARSLTLSGTILGWDLEINQLVKIDTSLIKNTFLIMDIEYVKGNEGTTSNIILVDKDLFKYDTQDGK